MENLEIARRLGQVADLLQIQGANPFRVRAYRNAARTVNAHAVPMRKLLAEGADLTELPGIGKEMAGHIRELAEEGGLSVLDELSAEVPVTLVEVMQLPGVGPKKAARLWRELGVETVEDLGKAAAAGRVAALEGFGERSQEKLLAAVRRHAEREERTRLGDADRLIEPLLEVLRRAPGLERLTVAGSLRRRLETVGDVDLLAIAAEPEAVMAAFTGYEGAARVEMAGPTRARIALGSGLEVDLRVLPERSYGAAMVYFTGSKEHNIKLRQRALAAGHRLSEYGLFREEGVEPEEGEGAGKRSGRAQGPPLRRAVEGKRRVAKSEKEAAPAGEEHDPWAGELIAGRDEEEVYAALGLPWIPPELREDRGEIEAAARGELPELLELGHLRGDLQMHSDWSDGKNTIEEMVEGCLERGYEYLALTDHSPSLAMTGGLDARRLRLQWKQIESIQERFPEIRILRSQEVDILADGSLDQDDEVLEELDLVLVAIHSHLQLSTAVQTRRVLRALAHPAVDILGHPTARLIGRRPPIRIDIDEVLHCARENGVAVELNANPARLDLKDTHLMRARELGVPVVISTDAHRVEDLDLMRYGVEQARRAWLGPADVLNTLPVDELLARLRR